ncbi:CxxxxCH/CxxCH domain-containing protein [Geobacter sp. DSM 9736]|uniref:CxxxxCH/CxxCH domain c-type cytochrome n=1 Tax=Geobacter sp. DSM 9736 TaxID=1277350 RepID=UPI000B5125B5|nr:CxxxxCH/CxxCH domain-containing protein [Geobacter sp. DSM 9736]SNB46426.1 Geobacter sulfurreducens CxxxxCH...CXXCH domain-containing protein [Geobacter sp. DSM 9736]
MNRRRCADLIIHPVIIRLLLLLLVALGPDVTEAALDCYDCHGDHYAPDIRPIDSATRDPASGGFPGNHRTHLPTTALQSDCAICHPGSDRYDAGHRNGLIKLSSKINNSAAITTYRNRTSATPQTSVVTSGSCSSVNCHFETSTPAWGTDRLQRTSCNTCHSAPPTDGSHGKKHGDYFGTGTDSCSNCHIDHSAEPDPLAHALEAGKRSLAVQFSKAPNGGGSYTGTTAYPYYLPSQNPDRNGACTNLYCHSDGIRRSGTITPRWSDTATTKCYSCHRGRTVDNTSAACAELGGAWNSSSGLCTPFVNMTSNGHGRLVGAQWIRKYACYFCHNGTVDESGNIKDVTKHVNGAKEVEMAPLWSIVGRPAPSYDPVTKICDNVYCHSDGTAAPGAIRPFSWEERETECNTCHGHPRGSCANTNCHDGRTDGTGRVWTIKTGWKPGEDWKASIPMFPNEGPGTSRANSHPRHTETDFTCDQCHASTVLNGTCTDCHTTGIPPGSMSEIAHIDARFHVNKTRDVVFKDGGTYDPVERTCKNTACHTGGNDPVWGGSVSSGVICLSCHGTTGVDVDSFGFFQSGLVTKINLTEWATTGHGRKTADGLYPGSSNPPANFPGNPCWYCHDNTVLHKDDTNPFRLRQHPQFSNRFETECVYCHMTGTDAECLNCHSNLQSLAPQMGNSEVMAKHGGTTYSSGCMAANCHDTDATTHNSGAGFWNEQQKADVKNQYLMMGVCLKCHDDDSNGKCTGCHAAPPDNPLKYTLGFDPGTGFIKPRKAIASSVHFGYKHNRAYIKDGTWKGGKFCWDCHDPHGDKNIYMVQGQVATSTDGTFGIPQTRAAVSFTRKQSGIDYARTVAPYNGICNVCHTADSKHYRSDGGDGHSSGRVCTSCHEHRFADSHAGNQQCNSCHQNKPVPRHSGFGLPRDCTKCHLGTINKRMDIMGQFDGTSHHIQGTAITNRHCYACHWESTPEGLIDNTYHEGYNYKTYTSVKNAKVDLVLYGPGIRPATYKLYTTAVQFMASNIGTANERAESATISTHCLSCHNDQNNNSRPFEDDCRTPRQYAWDRQSIASRYSDKGTTKWGKYNSSTFNVSKKDSIGKAFSAHANAEANLGGWSPATGLDDAIPITRGGQGAQGVQCFDCHSSHGSKLIGVTSSYVTFNGTKNGGNLKETQAGKGGYSMTYKASSFTSPGAPNPYNAGAGQCFDCHMTPNAGTTPWGYQSTFGATAPIKGYFDSDRFGMGANGATQRFPYKEKPKKAGHLLGSSPLNSAAEGTIDGLCTPCHDPHGVSQSLGDKKQYAVPLLKGTWLTSPYKEDTAALGKRAYTPYVYTDQKTFGSGRITEDDTKFAGLCLRCHAKSTLTDGINKNQPWRSIDRVHESVKGWGTNSQHSFSCSKCHAPHVTSLPRLMHTNCLDYKHQGQRVVGLNDIEGSGSGDGGSGQGSFPTGAYRVNCHPTPEGWPNNSWNVKTPW